VLLQGGENVAKKQTDGSLALEQQRVIVIPAHDEIVARKLRVAAYARVSSSSEDQLNSYRVQNQYYSELISNNPDWEMVDIYADEGITGTSVEKREDFQRMMQDCRKGKIDRILVKSISRFARNTKDCLAAVRELKELGVSVQFEEQGIDTSKVSSEMVTAIMASLAQKGSESISSNVRWGVQKRMLDGTFISSSVPYGYEMFHGQLRILPSEAQFVKWIFQAYLSGLNAQSIAEQMNQAYALLGIENTRKWHNTTILYILSNERYIGDSLWQKTYATDSLPTRQIKNTGSKTQYYIEHTHTPIIDRDTYSAVQRLREKRKLGAKYNDDYQPNILKKRIMCANCNVPFQRKVRSGETKWMCRVHNNSKDDCPTFPIEEAAFHSAFCRLYYKLKHHSGPIFTQMLSNLQKIRYSRMLWSEDVISLNKKISDILSQVQFLTQLQQAGGVDPDTFISSNNKLSEQLRRLKQEKARLLDTDSDDLADRTRDLMDALEDGPDFLDRFDAELFDALVEKIIVDSNERLRFRLKNGLELTEQIERTKR
jgi:site-specific DNA recombinase